jgi:hypothetical protein
MNRLVHLNRAKRSIVAIAACVFWASFSLRGPTQEVDPKDANKETLILGPYRLGDLCRLAPTQSIAAPKDQLPTDADVIGELNKSSVYVLQQRVRRDKRWRFDGYPKVLVEGPLVYKLKDRMGRDFGIQLREFTIAVDNLNYTVSPMTQRVQLNVAMRADGVHGFTEWHRQCGIFVLDANGNKHELKK